ncbi:hypothetical protein AU476_05415 [Cupriavidus sp. UYMSc13B]|nr:hypothetical protein AU476_05415 [Cupriavidus sp. UYMSc13B]
MHKPLIHAATIAAAIVCSAIGTAVYARGPATDCSHIFGSNSRPRVATTDQASRIPLLRFRGYAVQTSATAHLDQKASRKVSLITLTSTATADRAAVVDTKEPQNALHQSGVLPVVRAVRARC